MGNSAEMLRITTARNICKTLAEFRTMRRNGLDAEGFEIFG
jgi:hypothetical protein